MKRLKKIYRIPVLFALIGVSAMATGCGGQAYRELPPDEAGNVPGASTTGTTNGTTSGTDGGFLPAMSFSFAITGSAGTTPSFKTGVIHTDNTLKVRINAGAAGPLSNPTVQSNYTANYYCVSYQVSVVNASGTQVGASYTTQVMAINGGGVLCPQAPSSDTVDLSNRFGSGHGDLYVKVSNPRYDLYCQYVMMGLISWQYQSLYCNPSLYPVYQYHNAAGSLDVQVNGTSL